MKVMKRVKSLFSGNVFATPYGMVKCLKHNVYYRDECSLCKLEKLNELDGDEE